MVAVLGAGAGSRMGGGKLGKDLGGRPLGAWALSAALGLSAPVVLIASLEAPLWLDPALPGVELVANPQAASGMASSLVLAGRMALERQAGALLVMLADMPFVSTATLRALVARTTADRVTACRYEDGHLGPPACFGRLRLDGLLRLSGDAGARHLLNQPGFAEGLDGAGAELMDVDTQEDLQRARMLMR